MLADPATEVVDGETYGGLKALCEEAAEAAMPGRVLNVRPGLIVGPWDPSDRFTYWPRRIAAGGDVLLPGGPERPVQFIDGRDLAAWMLSAAHRGLTGIMQRLRPRRADRHGGALRRVRAACPARMRGRCGPTRRR